MHHLLRFHLGPRSFLVTMMLLGGVTLLAMSVLAVMDNFFMQIGGRTNLNWPLANAIERTPPHEYSELFTALIN